MRFALSAGLALGLALAAPLLATAASAATGDQKPLKDVEFSFDGPLGTYNRADLQHGFQVYKEVCSACHSLNRVAFHALAQPGGPEFTEPQMKAIAAGYKVLAGPNDKGETVDDKGNALLRAGIPADYFPPPFANEEAARAANGGALIEKQRAGSARYVYSFITGFGQSRRPISR